MGGRAIVAGIGVLLLAAMGLLVVRLGLHAGRRFREGRWLGAVLALVVLLTAAEVGLSLLGFALFWDPPQWANGDWFGAIVGGGIGLLGVVIGAYFTVKNTKGPRERAAVTASILYWMILVVLFVSL